MRYHDRKKEVKEVGNQKIEAVPICCTQYLSLIIHTYFSQNPKVKLQLFSCDSNDAMKKVATYEADLAIIAGPCNSAVLETLPLAKEDLVLVTTKELYDKYDTQVLLKDFPFITYKSGSNLEQLVNECLDELGFTPDNYIECVTDETIKRTALYHTGIALLGSAIVEAELRKGILSEIHRFPGKIETSMVILKKQLDEQMIHSFSEIVKEIWMKCG